MAEIIRDQQNDAPVQKIKKALDEYEAQHTGAEAALYRQNTASIRVRVIDRLFEGMTKSRRHDMVWEFLAARVDADTLAEVSLLLAIAPAELRSSLMNYEFDDPSASQL